VAVRIVIDRDRCVGSGNCLYWAPGTFDLDDDGISIVVDPRGDDEDRIRVAAEGCPTRALTLHPEDQGGPGAAPPAHRQHDRTHVTDQTDQTHVTDHTDHTDKTDQTDDQGASRADRTD